MNESGLVDAITQRTSEIRSHSILTGEQILRAANLMDGTTSFADEPDEGVRRFAQRALLREELSRRTQEYKAPIPGATSAFDDEEVVGYYFD